MFEFTVPSRIVFGQGIINKIGELTKEYGERVFLVSDALTMQETGFLTKVKKNLEDESYGVLVFNKVYPDSNSDLVNKGADQARHAKCDVIIGFGRKTTLNIAKAIAFLVSNDGNLEDYFLGRKGDKKKVAYIEVPSGHGYMPGLTNYFYVLDKFDNTKKSVETKNNYADLVVVDPKLTTTIAAKFTTAIGCENLSIAIESYISKAANAISDSFSIKAIEYIGLNLAKAVQDPENVNYRSNLSTAGILTSLTLANASPGICFALSLALNSVCGVYQGISSTILIPHVMEFNLTSAPNRYVQIARAFGEDVSDITVVEAAIKAIESIRKILFDLKVPTKLSELEINKEDLYKVAKVARTYDFLHFLPRPVSKEDLYNILIAAY